MGELDHGEKVGIDFFFSDRSTTKAVETPNRDQVDGSQPRFLFFFSDELEFFTIH